MLKTLLLDIILSMGREEATREERLKKLNKLKEKGINPYPIKTSRDFLVSDLLSDFEKLCEEEKEVVIAGRIMATRGHGGMIFLDIFDGTGRIQVVLKKENMEEEIFDFFEEVVDNGDFVEFNGVPFYTKRGEPSVQASNWKILSKSLHPLPSEWYGLKDDDARFRNRPIDILLNPEVRETFKRKSDFWQSIRNFFLEKKFMEVETPVFETTPGGADAKPFLTHHNALDMEVHLRISAGELWQKRLLVAGFNKVFEIGRIFRNEGISTEHLQEYTQLEFYEAYSDYEKGMDTIKELYRKVALDVYGKTEFEIRGHNIDLNKEWEKIDYSEFIKERFNVDPLNCELEDLLKVLDENSIKYEKKGASKARAVDLLWKSVRKEITGPAFLVGIPVYLEPLAKRNPENSQKVERFQVLIAGSELGKGFSELNDPVDQRARFEEQQKLREEGDEEAHMKDSDYIRTMEYGMPPAFGFGLSERVFSFFEDKSVRETQIFPLLRPKE